MKLYAIEGVDGVGKSTAIDNLRFLFSDDFLHRVAFTKQPFSNRKMLHSSEPFEKLYLFMLDHQRHVPVIESLSGCYDAVITDRYMHSRIAYQTYDIVNRYNLNEDDVIEYIENIHKYTIKPDKVFLLVASKNQLYNRTLARQLDAGFKSDDDDTNLTRIENIQNIYLKIASKNKRLIHVIHTDNLNSKNVAIDIKNRILKDIW